MKETMNLSEYPMADIKMPLPIVDTAVHERGGTSILSITMDASGIANAPSQRPTVNVIFRSDEEINEETIAAKLSFARRTVQNNIAMVDPKHDVEPFGLPA